MFDDYDWTSAMGGTGIPGLGLPQASSPFRVMPVSSNDFDWSIPQTSGNPFAGGVTAPQTPQAGGLMGWFKDGQNLSALAGGLSALSRAWLGYNQLKLAKEQLGFQRDAFSKNFANQTQSYNTSLEDRIRGRSANPDEAAVQAYLAKHRLGS